MDKVKEFINKVRREPTSTYDAVSNPSMYGESPAFDFNPVISRIDDGSPLSWQQVHYDGNVSTTGPARHQRLRVTNPDPSERSSLSSLALPLPQSRSTGALGGREKGTPETLDLWIATREEGLTVVRDASHLSKPLTKPEESTTAPGLYPILKDSTHHQRLDGQESRYPHFNSPPQQSIFTGEPENEPEESSSTESRTPFVQESPQNRRIQRVSKAPQLPELVFPERDEPEDEPEELSTENGTPIIPEPPPKRPIQRISKPPQLPELVFPESSFESSFMSAFEPHTKSRKPDMEAQARVIDVIAGTPLIGKRFSTQAAQFIGKIEKIKRKAVPLRAPKLCIPKSSALVHPALIPGRKPGSPIDNIEVHTLVADFENSDPRPTLCSHLVSSSEPSYLTRYPQRRQLLLKMGDMSWMTAVEEARILTERLASLVASLGGRLNVDY